MDLALGLGCRSPLQGIRAGAVPQVFERRGPAGAARGAGCVGHSGQHVSWPGAGFCLHPEQGPWERAQRSWRGEL